MKRTFIGAAVIATLAVTGATFAAPPEPVGISLLRIEMKKVLMQQDVGAKLTQLRQRKLQELQAAGKTDEAADAEIDLIQAQTAEAVTSINYKQIDLQLKESLKAISAPPAPPATQPGAMQPGEESASPTEIALLQYDVQKARLQADAAAKIADNRQKVLAAKQSRPDKATDAEADALSAQTSARLAQLDLEAAQMRLDAAVKSTQKK
jgi:hypothetical protein